ncbi:MAG: RluA family pseudouridine synthase [Planctomycetota bacterium]
MKVLAVEADWSGITLDEFLAAHWPRIAKGKLRDLVRSGGITVDGMPAQPSDKLRTGQVVLIEVDMGSLKEIATHRLDLEVLYEDEHLVAVNKPAGIPVEPSRWGEHPLHLSGALLDWAERRQEEGPLEKRPRGLHRLDLGTTGVMLYALSLEAERYYRNLFESRMIDKTYHALVVGEVGEGGTIDLALAPDGRRTGSMRVDDRGKPSVTDYAPVERFRGYSLVEAFPRTGRTHQIRVHLASIGHPLMVDPRYGGSEAMLLSHLKSGYRPKKGQVERPLMDRLTLHARSVRFVPFGGTEEITIEADYPKDFRIALDKLRRWRPFREIRSY